MLRTYNAYLETPKSLSLEKMQDLHRQIIEEIEGDMDALELYQELIEKATQYASYRAEWILWDKQVKMDRDPSRTSCHNSLIIKFNMLTKYLRMKEKTAKWRDELGYETDDAYNRKAVGDFACYLVFVNSLNAR